MPAGFETPSRALVVRSGSRRVAAKKKKNHNDCDNSAGSNWAKLVSFSIDWISNCRLWRCHTNSVLCGAIETTSSTSG